MVKQEKYVDLYKSILQKNNPKHELNHVYFDEENMVATDTRILMIHKHGMEVKTPFSAINPKIKKPTKEEMNKPNYCDYSLSKNKALGEIGMGKQTWTMKEVLKFPLYDRIIPQSLKYEIDNIDPIMTGLDILYRSTIDKNIMFNYVKFAQFMRYLDKIKFRRYYFKDKYHPVMLENDDLKVVIMPLVF